MWQSVEVWVIGGGTHRGGVVSVWCGMVSGPKQRVIWVPSSLNLLKNLLNIVSKRRNTYKILEKHTLCPNDAIRIVWARYRRSCLVFGPSRWLVGWFQCYRI